MKNGQLWPKIFIGGGKKKTTLGKFFLEGSEHREQSVILTRKLSDKILNRVGLMGHFRAYPHDLLMRA